ncbi:MAG: histidine phosphatase family protein, partial [Paludibacteraceae bacterium]|nr:histidine phosphatase family protein [Paludibacteraceae bacterium]
MVRLLLCRHGQTEWNVAHRFQGQSNSDLTPLGKRQAVRLGERLGGINIDA